MKYLFSILFAASVSAPFALAGDCDKCKGDKKEETIALAGDCDK